MPPPSHAYLSSADVAEPAAVRRGRGRPRKYNTTPEFLAGRERAAEKLRSREGVRRTGPRETTLSVRKRLVSHLHRHGRAMWGADLADAVNVSLEVFWTAIYGCGGCGWFHLGAGGWTLTPLGLAAGEALAAGREPEPLKRGMMKPTGRKVGRPRKQQQAAA